MADTESRESRDIVLRDRRGTAPGRDWTKGSITRNLLMLSWPMVISQVLNMIGPTIDMIWVGKLGTAPIAGVGIAGMIVMFVTALTMGIVTGARAMVARFVGAGDDDGAKHVSRQAFVIGVLFTAVLVSIGISLTEPIIALMGVAADVATEGAAYMRIMFVGSATMTFRMMAEGVMQASGDTVNPMRISIFYRAAHVVLCPFLIFGWWIFPQLGVSGAALTNVFSQSLGLGIGMWFLFSGRTRLHLTLSNFRLDLNMIWRIVRIGIPAAVMSAQRGLSHIFLLSFMVPYGTVAVAAHTLGQRLDVILLTLIQGFGMGAGVLAGQNLGAGQPERAERGAWITLGITEAIAVLSSGAIFLWAENIVSIFNTEPDLVELAGTFLRINIGAYMVVGFIAVFMHTMIGAGDTLPAMIIELAHMWAVMVPLALILPRFTTLGVYGIRWGIVAGVLSGAAAYLIYFRTGRWKRKKV